MFGYFNDPLNKKILYGSGEKEYHIIGVVKDFNFSSLRENITPVVMMLLGPFEKKKQGDGENADALCIRTNTNNLPALLAQVENKWNAIGGHQHFDYSFMDEDFDAAVPHRTTHGKAICNLYCVNHFHCMPGIVWTGRLCYRTADKRNQHPQSAGCQCNQYCGIALTRFYKTGDHFHFHCSAIGMGCLAKMVAGVRLPYYYALVGIAACSGSGNSDCVLLLSVFNP